MADKGSQVRGPSNEQVVYIGIHPEAFDPANLPPGLTTAALAERIERGWAAIRAEGVEGELALIGTDPDEAEAELRRRFAAAPFGVALIGGGIRMNPAYTALFERIANVLVDIAPGIRFAFNTEPEDSLAAIRRWVP